MPTKNANRNGTYTGFGCSRSDLERLRKIAKGHRRSLKEQFGVILDDWCEYKELDPKTLRKMRVAIAG